MRVALLVAALGCGLVLAEGPTGDQDFISQPQDVWVKPGDTVHLDCELVHSDEGDICAWQLAETHLGVEHFYNAYPPPKVRSLFPDHQRVCSIVIEQVDWRHDGLWTCWPLDDDGHITSRAARVTVMGASTPYPTDWPPTTEPAPTVPESTTPEQTTTTEAPTTTPAPPTTTAAPSTTPEPPTTTVAPPTTTPELPTTTVAPPTTTVAPPTTGPTPSPGPGFVCPKPTGLFADPDDARYFYYCKDGVAVHMQCESPMVWDDSHKTCA